jgi:hypothetical protein
MEMVLLFSRVGVPVVPMVPVVPVVPMVPMVPVVLDLILN